MEQIPTPEQPTRKPNFRRQLGTMVAAVLLFACIMAACDIYQPRMKFSLAVPKSDFFYMYMAAHLEKFLEKKGYDIEIIDAASAIEANNKVASGEADLALINNVSVSLVSEEAGELRSVLPLTTRLLIVFTKDKVPDTTSSVSLLSNKRIGLELVDGETHRNFEQLLARTSIKGSTFVSDQEPHDIKMYWGYIYGETSKRLLAEGWHQYSFKQNWIEFQSLNDPGLKPFTQPSIPGEPNSIRVNTLATETILVTRRDIGENAIFQLSKVIFENKLTLIHEDLVYRNISETFDREALIYPLHEGALSFLERDEPHFIERYADPIALVFSIIAIVYAIFQAVSTAMARRRKEHIDLYFIDFLTIRSEQGLGKDQMEEKLRALFDRAVVQLTNEKLDKGDFSIFSRLIQQELTILRLTEKR